MTFSKTYRLGQSLIEVLVAIGVGTIMIVAATGALVPALTINKQLTPLQTGTTLAVQLLDNVRTWSEGNWNNILSLATGTANAYYLNTANSPFTAVTGTEPIVTSINPPGLVGWWPLNEGTGTIAYDASGNNATGSWNGTAAGSSTYYSPGNVSSWAGYFNGSNDYVSVPSSATISPTNALTLSGWVKESAAPAIACVLGKWLGGSEQYKLCFLAGVPYIDVSGTGSGDNYRQAGGAITMGVWTYVAGVYDGSNLYVYVNGSLSQGILTGTVPGSLYSGSSALMLGADVANTHPFQGLISDVRIYNTALTATQINQIYTAQKYTRSFYLSDVYRTGGNIVTSGGTYDPSTKMVTVQYQIPPGITSTISTYITRHAENIFDQTDWSGGGGVSSPVTIPGNTFASSSGIDYTTTTGSFYLAIPGY